MASFLEDMKRNDPKLFEAFETYVKSLYEEPAILFPFVKGDSHKEIIEQFIREDARYQVNIPSYISTAIQEAYASQDEAEFKKQFEAARVHVLRSLSELFNTFTGSEQYANILNRREAEKVLKAIGFSGKETLGRRINDVHSKLTQFGNDMAAEAKSAKAREDTYKKINNARFFVKLQSGVSDALKAKCLPLIKATQTAIADAVKSTKDKQNACELAIKYADHITAPHGCPAAIRESFAKAWNEGICKWEAAEKSARDKVEAAKAKEKAATSIFDKYLKDKQSMKELGGDDYKAFKKQYEDLAKTL